ncbi:hypothetical protein C9374_006102 [Naegleria lovaniensis]|uniref:Rho family small GTPase n=1 Tax=Naegleria lovaniensis TaxID=51637 RepID=A0AA88GPC9_NAELO|nr:uncharacterized protein C9374_006102 [Naegleria lovaniensis]KAG2381718.1 hypothetical protein C9374_006102 [Naegleria lovaniensis]
MAKESNKNGKPKNEVKVVVVGDAAVGKTSLLSVLMGGSVDLNHVEQMEPFDSIISPENVKGIKALEGKKLPDHLHIRYYDTRGRRDEDNFRWLYYPQTNLFVICCSLSSKESIENVENRWFEVIRYKYKMIPFASFIVVGLKCDDPNAEKDARKVFKTVTYSPGFGGYVQCSSLTQQGIMELKELIIQVGVENLLERNKKEGCCLMQ